MNTNVSDERLPSVHLDMSKNHSAFEVVPPSHWRVVGQALKDPIPDHNIVR